jgi:hypothetical protein
MTTTLTAPASLPSAGVTSHRGPGGITQLRRHWLAAIVIAIGVALRVLVMIAYPRGFWLQGDSQEYLGVADYYKAGSTRPAGYGAFLAALSPAHSVELMIAAQHLLGVAVAVAGYAFLYRRGVPRWIAAIAIAPALLDGRTLTLEHFLLSEAFFSALLVAGCLVLLWRKRPGVIECAVAGLLFAGAALTRSVGVFVLVLPVLYLIVRRLGWRQFVAFALAVAVSFGGYLGWAHASFGQYSLSVYSGRFLWGRTTTFMDCSKLSLTPQEVRICPKEPIGQRPSPDLYLWTRTSVVKYTGPSGDSIHLHLALKAIAAQPADYLGVVARDTWDMMIQAYPSGGYPCMISQWYLPADHGVSQCRYLLAPVNSRSDHYNGDVTEMSGPLMTPLHDYSRAMTIPGGASGLALVIALIMAARPRRPGSHTPAGEAGRARLDPLLMTAIGFGIILLSAASAGIDMRYVEPALPLSAIGAGLAFAHLGRRTSAEDEPTSTTTTGASGQ